MEESSCDRHLRSKTNKYADEEIRTVVLKLLRADPDLNGSNCEWIIDSFIAKQFRIDEDEETVKEEIKKFKELFGERRPLPKKGYAEMKVMNSQKLDKESKKSIAKSQTKTIKTDITDCQSFYKYVKHSLPAPYNGYSKTQSDELFQMIEEANPTGDLQVCIWIVEEIKSGYIKEEKLKEVKKYLSEYLKLNLPLPNFYPTFPSCSNYQLVKDTMDKNVDLLFTGEEGILLIPQTQEASCYYGGETKWCTAQRNKNNAFETYAKRGNIYTWFDKKLKDKFQFHFEEEQFKDRIDKDISKQRFDEFRKHPILSVIFNEEEQKMLKNRPSDAFKYATNIIKGRWPEAEPYFMKSNDAYLYAKNIIKGRWPEAEPYIMKDAETAFKYATNIIKGRWPEAEHYIMKDAKAAFKYAQVLIEGRWREAEPYIMKDKFLAAKYVNRVIKDPLDNRKYYWPYLDRWRRWDEAEPYFMEDPEAAYDYARVVIHGRWPEAEPYIMENPEFAVKYARDVIHGRWPEAEPYILKYTGYAVDYAREVIHGRWPEAEPAISKNRILAEYYDDYSGHPEYLFESVWRKNFDV